MGDNEEYSFNIKKSHIKRQELDGGIVIENIIVGAVVRNKKGLYESHPN